MLFAVASASILLFLTVSNPAYGEISRTIPEINPQDALTSTGERTARPDVETSATEKEPDVGRPMSGFLNRIVACGTSLMAALITSELAALHVLASPIFAGIGTTLVATDSSIAPSPSSAVFLTLSIRLPASALPNR